MKLADKMNGPIGVVWVVAALFAVLSVLLISGRGSSLIAGYNTASKEEKEKYDEKKLCKVVGYGMAVITILLLVIALFYQVLPLGFIYVFIGIVIADSIVIVTLCNTICKK